MTIMKRQNIDFNTQQQHDESEGGKLAQEPDVICCMHLFPFLSISSTASVWMQLRDREQGAGGEGIWGC